MLKVLAILVAFVMSRPAKKHRWQNVLHEGSTTMHGLQRIIAKLGSEPVGRATLASANRLQLEKVIHVEAIERLEGEPFLWEMAEPNLLLAEMVSSSPALQEMFAQAAREHKCAEDAPWDLILGFDEFTPGNKLDGKNSRKTMTFSFSVLQLGHHALSQDLCWMTSACIRSSIIREVRGGWSRLLRVPIRQFMLGPLAAARVGIPLNLHGQLFNMYARVRILFSDLDGLRMAFDWRGAGSTRPCLACSNIWRKGYTCIEGHDSLPGLVWFTSIF